MCMIVETLYIRGVRRSGPQSVGQSEREREIGLCKTRHTQVVSYPSLSLIFITRVAPHCVNLSLSLSLSLLFL
jgi:hypothetical protein